MGHVVRAGDMLLLLRQVQEQELEQVLALCEQVQWMVCEQDLRDMHVAKPESFIGAFDQLSNKLVGVISGTSLDKSFGYISLFIVSETHQGRGVGRVLLCEALHLLRDCNIHLDASPNTKLLYQKFGFHAADNNNYLIEGNVKVIPRYTFPPDLDIVKVTSSNITGILKFDKHISKIDRSDHLPTWLLSKCCNAYAAFNKGRCVGFGAARFCTDLFKIQPLYADSLDTAIALMQCLLIFGMIPTCARVVFFPVVQNMNQALALAWRFRVTEVTPVGHCMYTRKELALPWRFIFSRTNKLNTIV